MSLIVSGHDFVLDPAVVNNITAVDLPSFSEPTATAAVTTTFEFSEDPSSNEIEVLITISNRFYLTTYNFCYRTQQRQGY